MTNYSTQSRNTTTHTFTSTMHIRKTLIGIEFQPVDKSLASAITNSALAYRPWVLTLRNTVDRP